MMRIDSAIKPTALAMGVALVVATGLLGLGRRDRDLPVAAAEHAAATSGAAISAGPRSAPVQAAGRDREIFRAKLEYLRSEGLDTVGTGAALIRIGRTFLGTPYVPHTLELPGPERLVVNLRELDCVTFVENALALARMAPVEDADFEGFMRELERIRYRDGVLDGYASRLHYFSDWIADNEALGLVRDVTRELGGSPDHEPVDFMSTHPDAYRQLTNPDHRTAIREVETAIGERERYVIPQERIAEVAPWIRDGDIIAATSSVEGLDVAHTGIAIWVDGALHLMHAPLVGKAVEISELPLADRIRGIDGQDGIIVARPL